MSGSTFVQSSAPSTPMSTAMLCLRFSTSAVISSTVSRLAVSDRSRLHLSSVMKLARFDAFELVRDIRLLPVRSSIDSESDSVGNVTGGNKCGFKSIPDSFSTSSPVRITEFPSSVEIDTRGGSSTVPSLATVDALPVDMTEFRLDDNACDPCVLVLNRDGKGGFNDIMLSRLPWPPTVVARSIMLCLAVRSTFFSANGKYSVR